MLRVMLKPVSPARRRASLIVLLVLLPLLVGFGWRAQGQWNDFQRAQALYRQVDDLIDHGKAREAIPILHEAVRLCPTMVPAWEALSMCYLESKQEQKAIEALVEARKENPRNATIEKSLGYAYMQAGRYSEATQCFEEASRLDPTDPLTKRLVDRCQKAAKSAK